MKTDDPRACRWCGDPLPERRPGQLGRPRVAHPGTCQRKHRNRQKLDARCALFRAAHRLDRSDDQRASPENSGVDFGDLDDGWSVSDGGWDGVPIPPPVLEAWEAEQRLRRRTHEQEQREDAIERSAAFEAFRALPDDDRAAYLRRAIERRQRLAAFRTQFL